MTEESGAAVAPILMIHPDDLDVTHALEQLSVPAYVIDRDGRFRWLNRGAIETVGARVGVRASNTWFSRRRARAACGPALA